jgi:hypothetical protein
MSESHGSGTAHGAMGLLATAASETASSYTELPPVGEAVQASLPLPGQHIVSNLAQTPMVMTNAENVLVASVQPYQDLRYIPQCAGHQYVVEPSPFRPMMEQREAFPESAAYLPEPQAVFLDHAASQACWGAQLQGDASRCTPGFTGGTAHFKNKFCLACRTGEFQIPISRVCALPPDFLSEHEKVEGKRLLSNGKRTGFWKIWPRGEGRFRFVNNTLECSGPQVRV